ncbi:PH domain-containing protein [Candidatus Uhrbacteria bacterium]|nr:PH domain-containing protein [Candidatus Uhrbacteria bacterium]
MRLAMSKTREQFPLSYKKVWKKTIIRFLPFAVADLIFIAVLAGAIGAGEGVWDVFWLLTIILLLLLGFIFLGIYFFQRWCFAVYFYDLTPDHIIIRKGPITPSEITIPYQRIQDVYVDQDIFDRLLGLYDVHFSSATISSGLEAHIDGVGKPAAKGLRQIILDAVSEKLQIKKG